MFQLMEEVMLLEKVNADNTLVGELKAAALPGPATPVMSTPTLVRVIANVAQATKATRAAG
ncbi:hypothetical protein AWN90_21145 [Nocardia terpenica]|uniref:Uncharacterized protein n=2 Tax=Nocardia terpenica TaxID=455432 RepID=A0A164NPW7_9NOCA|nr:hypothetical protein AWN90_21145 [Nocardia terpenica]